MKATDLRVGNTVYYSSDAGNAFQIGNITAQDLSDFVSNPQLCEKRFKPVLLTDERLFKMKTKNGDILFDGKDFIRINESSDFSVNLLDGEYLPNIYYASYDSLYNFLSPIKYLHELQNLVFVLTGKEMEVVYE